MHLLVMLQLKVARENLTWNLDWLISFDQHISPICSKSSKTLHALGRIATFMSFNKRRTLIKAFIESQFNYCPLMWKFHSRAMNNKINRIHERALRLVYSGHVSSFDLLLEKRPISFYSPQEHSKSSNWTLQIFSRSFSKYHENCLPFQHKYSIQPLATYWISW